MNAHNNCVFAVHCSLFTVRCRVFRKERNVCVHTLLTRKVLANGKNREKKNKIETYRRRDSFVACYLATADMDT